MPAHALRSSTPLNVTHARRRCAVVPAHFLIRLQAARVAGRQRCVCLLVICLSSQQQVECRCAPPSRAPTTPARSSTDLRGVKWHECCSHCACQLVAMSIFIDRVMDVMLLFSSTFIRRARRCSAGGAPAAVASQEFERNMMGRVCRGRGGQCSCHSGATAHHSPVSVREWTNEPGEEGGEELAK